MGPERRGGGDATSRTNLTWAEVVSRDDVEALRSRVVRAVRRACPPWLRNRAEDIVQNVLIQLLAKRCETNPSFSAIYLEKAAYGATVDEIRRLSRTKENPVADEELIEAAPASSADPERSASSFEIGEGIHECLAGLARPRRLAVTLWLLGCSVPEIARRRAWSFKRAHNLVYRGLDNLRACLLRKGFQP